MYRYSLLCSADCVCRAMWCEKQTSFLTEELIHVPVCSVDSFCPMLISSSLYCVIVYWTVQERIYPFLPISFQQREACASNKGHVFGGSSEKIWWK